MSLLSPATSEYSQLTPPSGMHEQVHYAIEGRRPSDCSPVHENMESKISVDFGTGNSRVRASYLIQSIERPVLRLLLHSAA